MEFLKKIPNSYISGVSKTIKILEPLDLTELVLPDNSELVTESERRPETKSILKGYHLANYKRKSSVVLVPDINAGIDILLFRTEDVCELTL
jgi:hypothetical protein